MRKKMVIAGIVLVVIVIFLTVWYYMFCYMGIGPAFPFLPLRSLDIESTDNGAIADDQLMALVETQEEAEEIAAQYGIELTYFSEGVAAFRTDEDPQDVIERGRQNGYPQLYINYITNIAD